MTIRLALVTACMLLGCGRETTSSSADAGTEDSGPVAHDAAAFDAATEAAYCRRQCQPECSEATGSICGGFSADCRARCRVSCSNGFAPTCADFSCGDDGTVLIDCVPL